jgi:hypothetical protein
MKCKNYSLLAVLLFVPTHFSSAQPTNKRLETPPTENPCKGVIRRMPIDYRVDGDSATSSIIDYDETYGDFRGAMWQGAKILAIEFGSIELPQDGWFGIGFWNEQDDRDSIDLVLKKGSYKNHLIEFPKPIFFKERQAVSMGIGNNAKVTGATFIMDLSDWVCQKTKTEKDL